jgi:hypothetical protein
MNDVKEENRLSRNYCRINVRTLKSTMFKEYNEITYEDKKMNAHSRSIMRDLDYLTYSSV